MSPIYVEFILFCFMFVVLRRKSRVLCTLSKHLKKHGPHLWLLTALKKAASITVMESKTKKLTKPSAGHTGDGGLLSGVREAQLQSLHSWRPHLHAQHQAGRQEIWIQILALFLTCLGFNCPILKSVSWDSWSNKGNLLHSNFPLPMVVFL